MEVRAIVPGVLNDHLPTRIVIPGDELIVTQPGDLASEVGLVVALFCNRRKASGHEGLDHIYVAAVAGEGAVLRMVIDEAFQLVRHHISVGAAAINEGLGWIVLAWLDDLGHVVAIALPAPEVQSHGEVGWRAVVPAVALIHVLDARQADRARQRCGGSCRAGRGTGPRGVLRGVGRGGLGGGMRLHGGLDDGVNRRLLRGKNSASDGGLKRLRI